MRIFSAAAVVAFLLICHTEAAVAQQDSVFVVKSAGETLLRVNEDGNVGIGIPIPTQKLHVGGGITADSAKLNRIRFSDDTEITTAAPAVHAPAFAAGWENAGTFFSLSWAPAAYLKDNSGLVRFDGAVRRTSGTGDLIMTLPVGFRPRGTTLIRVLNYGSGARHDGMIVIYETGNVHFLGIEGAAPAVVLLNSISFLPAP